MDFHSMKRKELQALCKKHKIPANLSNLEMANKLTEFFKKKENSSIQGFIKEKDEDASEIESTNVVMDRKVKKVRFSPEHELIEFTRSRGIKRRSRRTSVSSRDSSLSVENVDSDEMNNGNVGGLGRVTRSRGLNLMESEVNEKKWGIKGVKRYSQKNSVTAIENVNNAELTEDDVDKPGPVMQLRGKILVEVVKNASKRGRKRAKDDYKTDEKALDNGNDEKLFEENVDVPGRLTRSKGEKLMEASTGEDTRREVMENNNNAAFASAETDDNRKVSRKSSRTRGVAGEGKLARSLGERVKNNGREDNVLENKKIGGAQVMVEPQILLRRSKRNMNKVGDSEILNDDTKKHENGGMKSLRKIPNLLAAEGSGVDAESTGSKVELDGGIAHQIEEPIRQGLRRSNRRKDGIVSHENGELKEETENRNPLRSSVLQLGTAGGVSKVDKKLLQPTGVIRRSRRKTSSLELVSADEKIKSGAAVENFETENHLRKPCPVEKTSPAVRKNTRRSRRNALKSNSVETLDELGVDSIVQEENEARKRKRGDVIKTKSDSSSPTESMRKDSRSQKPAPAATTGKAADIGEPPSRLKEPNMLDASSHKDLLESGESFVDAQFSISEGARSVNNKGLSSDANVESIISDVGLTSIRKKQDISIADNASNADTRLINGNELANTEAASRNAELKSNYTDTEKKVSASNLRGEEKVHSQLEFDIQELIEENISDMDKNDTAAHLFSQTKNSSCHNTIDHQVLLEGSTVSGNACFAETSYSADSLLPADLEGTEAEADKHAQPSLDAIDGEVECVSLQGNLESIETGCTNTISSPIACHHDDLDHLESYNSISGRNNEDISSKAREVGAIKTCDGHIESTDLKSALQLEEPSLGKLRRSLEGDNTAEGDEIYSNKVIDTKVAENDEGGCLRDPKTASHENSEFNMPVLYGERSDGIISQDRSARIIPQDGGHAVINSDDNNYEDTSLNTRVIGTLESCDGHIESTDLKSALQLEKPSSSKLRRSLEGDNTAEGDEIYYHEDIDSKVAENDEGGCLRDHEAASNEDSESSVPELYGERSAPIIRQDRGHAVINFDEKAEDIGAFESSDGHIDSTNSKSALQLEEPSSGKLQRSLEGDNTAEGDEINFHKGIDSEVAENDEDGCVRQTASNEDSEVSVPEVYGERSAVIIPRDRGNAVINSDEQGIYNGSSFGSPITICANTTEINIKRGFEAHHIAKTAETYIKSVHSGFTETSEGGSCRCHKNKCDGDGEFSVSNLFSAERSVRMMPQDKEIFCGENSIKDFDDSPSEAPTTMCNCTEIKLRRDHEADQIGGCGSNVCKDIRPEFAEADESGCLQDQTGTKAEDWLYGVSNLFDAERSAPSTPQGCSSLQEISPSKPNSVSESKEAGTVDTIREEEVTIVQSKKKPGDEVSMDKTISDGKQELFNQADERSDKDTYEPEQPKSPVAASIQGQEAWSNGSETARHAVSTFKTDEDANDANCGKDKEDLVDASITDVSISMDFTISKIGVESPNELKFQDIKETEHECKTPLAMHTVPDVGEESSDVSSQSWTEFELNNLFGTAVDSVTSTSRNDSSCQGTETATLTISMNNSITSSASSLIKKKKETAVDRGSENAKTTNKNVVLQTNYDEASNIGSSLGSEKNQLKLLFATPIKIVSPCKVDETSAHEEKLDNAAMFKECVGTMKEDVTEIKSTEKVEDSGNEFENSLCVGNSLPNNGEDVTSEELNQVEGVDTLVLSGGAYDGCEASNEQSTENTCQGVRETNSTAEENKEENIISLGQSCEGTEKEFISSSGAVKNVHKVEGYTDLSENLSCGSRCYLKSEGELAQSSEVAVELSYSDFQKSSIPENGHHGCVDGNILWETPLDNFRGPMDGEVANVGSFDSGKYVVDKGTYPSLAPKACHDDDEVTERKDAKSIRDDDDPYGDISDTWDETVDNLRSSHDIFGELHANSEGAVSENLSVGFTLSQEAHQLPSTLQLQSAYKETNQTGTTAQNADNIDPAADHGSSACGAESDILSSMAMHLLLGDIESGDFEKSEGGTPLFNFGGDVETNSKEVEENPAEAIVQFSISKLHLEDKYVDSNKSPNDINTISDASTSRCNEILKESDVADTIKEYIDSESSVSIDFEGSGSSLPIDVFARIDERSTCANAALCDSKEAIDGKPSVESLATESKELEESTMFMKPAPGSEEAVKSSPASVDLLVEVETKGSTVNDTFLTSKEIETTSTQPCLMPKKNARTILIHGTPRKLLPTADMKENAPMYKSSNIGDFTTVRPAKRRALQDVPWK